MKKNDDIHKKHSSFGFADRLLKLFAIAIEQKFEIESFHEFLMII